MEDNNNGMNQGYNDSAEKTNVEKCPSCGANMVFDPLTQGLKCPQCGTTKNFDKNGNVQENDIENAFNEAEKWKQETTVYKCSNCGAEFVVKSDEVAVICPYCSTSHVVHTEDLSGLAPNAVYPFMLSHDQAAGCAKKWARGRIFSPSSFKKNLVENNVRGMYLPCFTFDSDTDSSYSGRIGEYRTRTVRDSKGNSHTETYTEWHFVSGNYQQFFDDLTISCGKMTQNELNRIMPFKNETLCVYEQKFLTGYTADHYSRDIRDCWDDAKAVMDSTIRQGILRYHGGDVIDYLNVNTVHNDVKYKYLLLPVYRLNYHFKKKDYPVLVNGSTGVVTGKAPISPLRVSIAVLLGLAVVAGIVCFVVFNDDSSTYSAKANIIEESKAENLSMEQYFEREGYKIKF